LSNISAFHWSNQWLTCLKLTALLCSVYGIDGWRQSEYNIKRIKKLYRRAQKLKASNSQDEAQKAKQQEISKAAYVSYLEVAQEFIVRAQASIAALEQKGRSEEQQLLHIGGYIQHAQRQIDQIKRRVLLGEVIPRNEN
jgi:IS5 family transposase